MSHLCTCTTNSKYYKTTQFDTQPFFVRIIRDYHSLSIIENIHVHNKHCIMYTEANTPRGCVLPMVTFKLP